MGNYLSLVLPLACRSCLPCQVAPATPARQRQCIFGKTQRLGIQQIIQSSKEWTSAGYMYRLAGGSLRPTCPPMVDVADRIPDPRGPLLLLPKLYLYGGHHLCMYSYLSSLTFTGTLHLLLSFFPPMQHFVFVKKALRTQSTKNCVTVVQKYKD